VEKLLVVAVGTEEVQRTSEGGGCGARVCSAGDARGERECVEMVAESVVLNNVIVM
jgi:hypothetical protein